MVSSNVDILKAGQIDLLSLKTRAEVLGGRGGLDLLPIQC